MFLEGIHKREKANMAGEDSLILFDVLVLLRMICLALLKGLLVVTSIFSRLFKQIQDVLYSWDVGL